MLGLNVLTVLQLVLATDLTALFLAMPSIAADLQPGSTQMLWILHIYGLIAGGLLRQKKNLKAIWIKIHNQMNEGEYNGFSFGVICGRPAKIDKIL